MNRILVISYMNMTLGRKPGVFSGNDAKIMSTWVGIRTGKYVDPRLIFDSVKNTHLDVMNKYLTGMWHSLIRHYDIEVVSKKFGKQDKIIQYK